MGGLFRFVQEAKLELFRVNWPNRSEVIHYTMLVVGISLFVSVFLGTLDTAFTWFVERFLLRGA